MRHLKIILGAVFLSLFISTNHFSQDKVMMQGFYWDVTPGGVWYDSLKYHAEELGDAGFSSIWFPPVYKGANGAYDVGYTPYDYYDLGEYDSRGGDQTSGNGSYIPTRYGTKAELLQAVNEFHNNGIDVYADIVLNHRSGGISEPNTYAVSYPTAMPNDGSGNTWTSFPLSNGSGRINWNNGVEFFYPNADVNPGNTSDFYSETQYGFFKFYQNYFAYDNALHDGTGETLPFGDSLLVWGNWLTNEIGFDGFRFDFVKGIHPVYLKEWCNYGAMNNKFYVGELYDGDIGRLKSWLDWMSGDYTGPGAKVTAGTNHKPAVFDFNLRFAYKAFSDDVAGYDIRNWHSAGLFNNGVDYDKIVTFVENHDFDRINYLGEEALDDHSPVINGKIFCYAHMLMSPGLASIWWRDYQYYGMKDEINELIEIRTKFASGTHYDLTEFTDNSGQFEKPYWPGNASEDPKHMLVLQRTGISNETGVILAINKHSSYNISAWVTSQKWAGMQLYDITGNSSATPTVQGDGRVLIETNANSYSVFVPTSFVLEGTGQSGHFPNESLGYIDGIHAHSYSVAPNYRQCGDVTNGTQSVIIPNSDADVYANFRYDTSGKTVYLIYTTDGSAPTKTNGSVVTANFSKYDDPNRWFYATIPSSANLEGNIIKYVFYISDNTLANAFGRIAGTDGYNSQYRTAWDEGDNYFEYKVINRTTNSGGNWGTGSTWETGNVPGNEAFIEVRSGANVTVGSIDTIKFKGIEIKNSANADFGTAALKFLNSGYFISNGTLQPVNSVALDSDVLFEGTIVIKNFFVNGNCSIDGDLQINENLNLYSGGSIDKKSASSSLTYDDTASLNYLSGENSYPGIEWEGGIPGIVPNVKVDGNTNLYLDGFESRYIAGNLIVESNSFMILSEIDGSDLNLGENLTLNGDFNTNYRQLVFNGSALQEVSIGAGSGSTFHFVNIDNSNNVKLNSDLTILNQLDFTNGSLLTNSNRLILSGNASINEIGSNYLIGELEISRAVQNTSSDFGGIGVTIDASGEDLGNVNIIRKSGNGASVVIGSNEGINRTWEITSENVPGSDVDVTLSWNNADDNGKNIAEMKVYKSNNNGASWNPISGTLDGSTRDVTFTASGFSIFTLADVDNPLPVEINYFNGKIDENKVILNWRTETEINNYGFEVEKYKEEKWNKIGFVEGNGNSNMPRNYSFEDKLESAVAGELKYRLKQVDYDGKSEFLQEINLDFDAPDEFALHDNYPNPFNPITKINFELPKKAHVKLLIYNSLGELVKTLINNELEAGYYSEKFRGNDLASGIYIYSIESEGFRKSKKMLLVK